MSPRPANDNPSRDGDWWTVQAVSLAALILFFFALFHVLAVIAPGRMPL